MNRDSDMLGRKVYQFYNIVTDLINALPGNSSVNTVQNATVEEAVFSVSVVTSHNSG
jgi:carbon monoxide dehydrogenase subunit G